MSPSLCNWECGSGPVHLSRFPFILFISMGAFLATATAEAQFQEVIFFIHLTLTIFCPRCPYRPSDTLNNVLVTAVLRNALPTSSRDVPKR